MVKYIGESDILDVIDEGMRNPRTPIELETDGGMVHFHITETYGKVISGRTTDGKLITIDPDAPEFITIT